MKKNWKQLWIYAMIGMAVAGTTGSLLYQNRLEFWRSQAGNAFHTALTKELQKRDTTDVYYCASGGSRLPDTSIDIQKEPIKVPVTSEYGKKVFVIPYEKHAHNIERPFDWRAIHSIMLETSPLNADSLNSQWKELLEEEGYSGKTAVRISVTDWWEHDSYTYSGDSLRVSRSDSLTTYYLGYRCEVGATGYLDTPWWMILSWKNKLLLVALLAACMLLFFVQGHAARAYRLLFVRKKPVVAEKEEEEVQVVACQESHSHIYQLDKKVYFDIHLRVLKKGDRTVSLMPLTAKLLQGFLDAKDFRLSNDEILQLLWPTGIGTSNNLHTNIRRLRACLSQISTCTFENENFAYRLNIPAKNPHSIEKEV